MLVIGGKVFIVKWTTAMRVMRVFSLVLVDNHTWQLIVCNSKGANIIAKVEMTCSHVIKDAFHENYESDHDLWLLNILAFISTESL